MTRPVLGGLVAGLIAGMALTSLGIGTPSGLAQQNAATAIPRTPTGRPDLNGSWQVGPRLGLFFQVRNLFNVPEYRYQVDPSYVLSNMVVGTFYTFGVKGTF